MAKTLKGLTAEGKVPISDTGNKRGRKPKPPEEKIKTFLVYMTNAEAEAVKGDYNSVNQAFKTKVLTNNFYTKHELVKR